MAIELRRIQALSAPFVVGTILAITGCGDGEQAPLRTSTPAAPKAADSVYREAAPGERSSALTTHLNRLRREALFPDNNPTAPTADYDVAHNDVLYTAAYRHAVYLNTLNSSKWSKLSEPSGGDTQLINAEDTPLSYLLSEPLAPTNQFPALYTYNALYQRIEAVRGGRDLLQTAGQDPRNVAESYVFNGDIWRKDGTASPFRGYNLDTLNNADASKYVFDAIDNIWYARSSRMQVARPSVRAFGYGNRSDSGQLPEQVPPYPILNNRFLGVVNTIISYPQVARLSYWPTSANNADGNRVHPYGLDTDIGGPNQYAGPPIHFTIPVDEPFLRDVGVVLLSFARADGIDPTTSPHINAAWRQYRVWSNVSGLVVPTVANAVNGFYRATGPVAPVIADATVTNVTAGAANLLVLQQPYTFTLADTADLTTVAPNDILTIKISAGNPGAGSYSYPITGLNAAAHTVTVQIPFGPFSNNFITSFPATAYGSNVDNIRVDIRSTTSTLITALVDKTLRNGELVIVPVAPLQNDTQYRVRVQVQTPSYNSGVISWTFTTDKTGNFQ